MKLKRAIAAIVLVSAFAAPLAAGTLEDAVDAHARGDYAKALRRPLANDGNATAQFNLGSMYFTGRGAQQDYSAAALWFRKAAEQDHPKAKLYLGIMYANGQGVEKDLSAAGRWFKSAAEQGLPQAQFRLGEIYAQGQGVTQDLGSAYAWFSVASQSGHSRAAAALTDTSGKLSPKSLEAAKRLAADLSKRYGKKQER